MPLTRKDAIFAAIAIYVVQAYTEDRQPSLYCLLRILIAGALAARSLGAWLTFTAARIKVRDTAPHEQ
jgi:hypothetical protein